LLTRTPFSEERIHEAPQYTVFSILFFLFGPTAPQWARGLLIHEVSRLHSDTPQPVELLWTSNQLVTETSSWQHTTHNRKTIHGPGGIRTQNLSRRAAADLYLRRGGHWDRHSTVPAYSNQFATQDMHCLWQFTVLTTARLWTHHNPCECSPYPPIHFHLRIHNRRFNKCIWITISQCPIRSLLNAHKMFNPFRLYLQGEGIIYICPSVCPRVTYWEHNGLYIWICLHSLSAI
jgi:hypothetical protein